MYNEHVVVHVKVEMTPTPVNLNTYGDIILHDVPVKRLI